MRKKPVVRRVVNLAQPQDLYAAAAATTYVVPASRYIEKAGPPQPPRSVLLYIKYRSTRVDTILQGIKVDLVVQCNTTSTRNT